MHRTQWWTLAALACVAIVIPRNARAADISGLVSTTRVITDNSRLVGDVTCTVTGGPCIMFGESHIELRLNGFTMTGQAGPDGCGGARVANEHGISSNGQTDVGVRGPGIVQRFRASGILFTGTLLGGVEWVTATTNCESGIRVNPTSSKINVGANIATRNGTTDPGSPCGGI